MAGGCPHQVLVYYAVLGALFIGSLSAYVAKERITETCTAAHCPAPFSSHYKTFQQMEYYLKALNASNPRVELESIGTTVEGRDLWMVKIRPYDKSSPVGSQRDAIWIEGGIHAREWISPATTLLAIHDKATNCHSNCDMDYYIVPMANPDGYEYSWTTDRLWRKNRALNEGNERNCKGVDLNRNWDVHFGVGASTNPCSQVYRGTHAFSEPETRALSDTMSKVKNLQLVLALHSYGQKVLYPYGFESDPPENIENIIEAGKSFKDAAFAKHGKIYDLVNSADGLYFASGATDDWSMKILSVPYSYTVELRDNGTYGFNLPSSHLASTAEETIAGVNALITKVRVLESGSRS